MGNELPQNKRGTAAPNFRPMSIVAKRIRVSVRIGLRFSFIGANLYIAMAPTKSDSSGGVYCVTIVQRGLCIPD